MSFKTTMGVHRKFSSFQGLICELVPLLNGTTSYCSFILVERDLRKQRKCPSLEQVKSEVESILTSRRKRKEEMSACCNKPLLFLNSQQFWLSLSSLLIPIFCLQSLILSSHLNFNFIFHVHMKYGHPSTWTSCHQLSLRISKNQIKYFPPKSLTFSL